jgi:aldehyde:ferredoxin oxidoreductase
MSYLTVGKILRIDLTDGTITTEPTAKYEGKFIGGRGITTKILYDEVVAGTDPLGPGNALIFGAGPLAGTPCPGAARTYIMAKSPMSGFLGAADCGGFWGPELKFEGYDAVVVKGKADKPVYITIDNDRVEIRDASGLWGKDTVSTQEVIRQDLADQGIQIFCIGPAGEKQVRYSTIAHGIMSAASRVGLGAVMGSKNLKAIAVRGRGDVKLADPKKYLDLCKADREAIMAEPWAIELSKLGHTRFQDGYGVTGVIGRLNYQGNVLQATAQEAFMKEYSTNSMACFSCPIGCRLYYKVPGLNAGILKCAQHGGFYQAGCFDQALNYEAAILCQEAGLDLIHSSGVISWLMELYQRGIVTDKDTDGIVMEWGNGEAVIQMLKKIIAREGIGDVLAENFMTAAGKFGKGAEDYFIHTKGVSVEFMDLRAAKGSALAATVNTRGDFLSGDPALDMMISAVEACEGEERVQMQKFVDDLAGQITGTPKAAIPGEYEGKAASVKFYETVVLIADILGVCKWHGLQTLLPMTPEKLAELCSAGKGVEVTAESLLEAAHRVHTLERAFCMREGLTRADDTLPKRFFEEPVPEGPYKGEKIDPVKLEKMKTEYYTLQGWDPETGVPTQATLEELGLNDVAEDLKHLRRETKEGKTKGKNVK